MCQVLTKYTIRYLVTQGDHISVSSVSAFKQCTSVQKIIVQLISAVSKTNINSSGDWENSEIKLDNNSKWVKGITKEKVDK